MTYTESAALMVDTDFRGRVKVACLKYADSILNEPNTTPAHSSRLKWANNAMQSPDMVAMQIQPPVVMDAAVQSAGAAVTDAELQGAVETTINRLL